MNKQAKRIIANVVDFDMHNLFPPMTPMENMEDAASGEYISQPKRTLRERSYTPNPIKVMPKYEGDFLEKLRKRPLQGRPVMPLETVVRLSENSENLWDFKGPDEWLKNQERPHPRNLVDKFYEMTKPGEGAGSDDLEDLYDRSWDNEDAPEISEDKVTRMFKSPLNHPMRVPFHTASQRVVASYLAKECSPDASTVIANYLMDCFPVEIELDNADKIAMLLKDLAEGSSINTKLKGTRKPGGAGVTVEEDGPIMTSVPGVSVSAKRYEPAKGRWTFTTSSGSAPRNPFNKDQSWPWPYSTVFQFIPYRNIRDTYKLHVRVSCSCPSWIFWGAQYNAYMNDYLYGGIRPKFAPPKTRDKEGKFLVCKHVLACLPLVSKFKLGEMPEVMKKRIEKAPTIKILPGIPDEVLKIPEELKDIALKPHIKEIEKNWDLKPKSRSSWVRKLEVPDELVYLTHRFPEASHLIAQRLKELTKVPKIEKAAEEALEVVEEIEKKVPKIIIPPELESLETNPDFIKAVAGWVDKSEKDKREFMSNEKNPDIIAFVAFKNRSDLPTITFAVERFKDISKNDEFLDKDREKAENWERRLI